MKYPKFDCNVETVSLVNGKSEQYQNLFSFSNALFSTNNFCGCPAACASSRKVHNFKKILPLPPTLLSGIGCRLLDAQQGKNLGGGPCRPAAPVPASTGVIFLSAHFAIAF